MIVRSVELANRQLAAVRRLVEHLAPAVEAGFSLRLWNGETVPLGPNAKSDLAVAVRSPVAITRLLRRPRLTTLVELIAEGQLDIEGGTLLDLASHRGGAGRGLVRRLDKRLLVRTLLPFLFGPSQRQAATAHAYSERSERDDSALVRFHYDLSNAFYALFLDPEMQYSCAYFQERDKTLEEAQRAKLDMICRKLRLRPGDHLLDIGCGWGGLICHAARQYEVRTHGVTLSEAQYAFVRDKIADLGLQDRVTVELKHYRDLTGEYDRIASIGMFEHVGQDHAAYFRKMRSLLRPRGLCCATRSHGRPNAAIARSAASVRNTPLSSNTSSREACSIT